MADSPDNFDVLKKLIAGSVSGVLGSLAVIPAKSHQDAVARGSVTLAVTLCTVPFITRVVAAYWKLSPEWIPDTTLMIGVAVGLVAWTAISCWVFLAEARSEDVRKYGLTALLKRKRP